MSGAHRSVLWDLGSGQAYQRWPLVLDHLQRWRPTEQEAREEVRRAGLPVRILAVVKDGTQLVSPRARIQSLHRPRVVLNFEPQPGFIHLLSEHHARSREVNPWEYHLGLVHPGLVHPWRGPP